MNITVEPTSDRDYILSVLTDPEMYRAICDDSCPATPEEMANAFLSPAVTHLRVIRDGVPAGLISILYTGEAVDMHAELTPACRGRAALEAGRKAVAYATSFRLPVTASVLARSRHAVWYAHQLGFRTVATRDGIVKLSLS